MDDILRQIHRHTEAPTYRVWKQAWMNETQRYVYNVYIVEPSGQALQLRLHRARRRRQRAAVEREPLRAGARARGPCSRTTRASRPTPPAAAARPPACPRRRAAVRGGRARPPPVTAAGARRSRDARQQPERPCLPPAPRALGAAGPRPRPARRRNAPRVRERCWLVPRLALGPVLSKIRTLPPAPVHVPVCLCRPSVHPFEDVARARARASSPRPRGRRALRAPPPFLAGARASHAALTRRIAPPCAAPSAPCGRSTRASRAPSRCAACRPARPRPSRRRARGSPCGARPSRRLLGRPRLRARLLEGRVVLHHRAQVLHVLVDARELAPRVRGARERARAVLGHGARARRPYRRRPRTRLPRLRRQGGGLGDGRQRRLVAVLVDAALAHRCARGRQVPRARRPRARPAPRRSRPRASA